MNTSANFVAGYVEDIFQIIISGNGEQLKCAENILKEMTPPPMNSMLMKQLSLKQLKEESRAEMTIVDVPHTVGNYNLISKLENEDLFQKY